MNPNTDSDSQDQPWAAPAIPHQSFWQKLGGASLSVAVLFHVILLLIGGFWVFQVIKEPEKKVDFMPPAGGGGERGAKDVAVKKQKQITPTTNVKRVFAEGATASYAIPEQGDNFGEMSALSSLSGGGMSGGLGGSGTGNGFGQGSGLGSGAAGGGGLANPFGLINPNENALVGTYYNLNFNAKGQPEATDNPKQFEIINDFVNGGWKESKLAKYQKAEQTLYQTKIYMPAMDASKAPSAFGLKPDPHPRWIIVYRGTLKAEKTGKFRFVGAGDDTLVVRFNGRNVFDFGFVPGTAPMAVRNLLPGTEKLKGEFRKSPMEPPVAIYKYPETPNWNGSIGGVAVGPEVSVDAGKSYPIEILISEGWGGLFCASLLMQETGVNYSKASTGDPILPLFRTDSSPPAKIKGDNCPPIDLQGPVWKVISQRGFTDI